MATFKSLMQEVPAKTLAKREVTRHVTGDVMHYLS